MECLHLRIPLDLEPQSPSRGMRHESLAELAYLPKPAQYLLRIDDLCPTIHERRWSRIRELIASFQIRPILAVIPNNLDRDLLKSPPDPGFWQQMRQIQEDGATIALHGYHHLCKEESADGLIPLHRRTEFAGVPFDLQLSRITRGLEILRGHGLDPKLFVAPRHGFDWDTLDAIVQLGVPILSDGMARVPFLRGGVTWLPMQLWSPVPQEKGVWTICIHPNSTDRSRFCKLESFLAEFAAQFTSFDRVLADFPAEELDFRERVHERMATRRLLLRRPLVERGISSRRR